MAISRKYKIKIILIPLFAVSPAAVDVLPIAFLFHGLQFGVINETWIWVR